MEITKINAMSFLNVMSLIFIACLSFCACDASISQISPKSSTAESLPNLLPEILSATKSIPEDILDSTFIRTSVAAANTKDSHIRVERSASPILNEISSKPIKNFENFNDIESNDVKARDFNYNIKPTRTVHDQSEDGGVVTQSQRMAKDLLDDPFLLKGGLRSLTSGSPLIQPTLSSNTVSQIFQTATSTLLNNHPRQNPNPDIQDIITGIVKLLNGNVNVHAANSQAQRRPVASRINNRGPPRINEAQPLPAEFDHPGSSMRPPPFPFDRPDGLVRPFINGVPIPEQIVPSMQQNYRPGFISQNRPPWHRPRPRLPITPARRPQPPYKQTPQHNDNYYPEDEIQIPNDEMRNNVTQEILPTDYVQQAPEMTGLDELMPTGESATEVSPTDTSTKPTKKKENKTKGSDKKPIMNYNDQQFESTTIIIESISEVNTAQFVATHVTPAVQAIEPTSMTDIKTTTEPDDFVLISSSMETPLLSTPIKGVITTTTTEQNYSPPPSSESSYEVTSESPSTHQSSSSTEVSSTTQNSPTSASPPTTQQSYHPRPGIVLDDPEFKPGGINRPPARPQQRPEIQPTRPALPPGYGEIFDVTLSAIQGPGSGSKSQQTIKIKPYGSYGSTGQDDIIIAPSGDESVVSIDGKRTYINLFGESTDAQTPAVTSTASSVPSSQLPLNPGVIGTGYASMETETPATQSTKLVKPIVPTVPTAAVPPLRTHYRPRTTQPLVRIDTCIVGDDTTCDQAQHERCKTENGVSSCHCRPGYSRRKHREPCRKVVSFFMSLRVDKFYERRIVWDKLLLDRTSEPYAQLSYESVRAIDSAMSMTPYSDEFMDGKVNNIYRGDASQGAAGVFVNLTIRLEENGETLRPNLRSDVQKHLLGVIHRRNNNIGNSVLYVDSPPGSISNLQDLDECQSRDLNDCHSDAFCMNIWGSFRCECEKGLRDPWSDQPQRAGRECHACPESHCNNRGTCSYDADGAQICKCVGNHYGEQCEIDGEVLGVAIGASVAALIIIVLTLVCLIMWSKRWHREQKNSMGSPVFGYMATAPVKTGTMMSSHQAPYQVTLEDRMRWAQIADVMAAQANHYAAEPVAITRPSSAMFGYPNLQAMNIGTLGGISMAGTLPIHQQQMPPVPLPRLGIHSRSNGMRTLENSSSSEEEDRTDLLGRNFQVPRPKSRSNGSIANQSGIYYDVDYEPSGGEMYGTTTNSTSLTNNPIPGPQGIPMSTYTSGRIPSSYYMK